GLFGRRGRAADRDDDEDDEDEDEDDEYDEYDDYDDEDEDDDYDDDDDDDGQPFGRHILGFFKGLFGFIVAVLLVVFVLNFLDFFNVLSLDSLFDRYYNSAPAVFDTLFPSHSLKQFVDDGETITAVDPLEGATEPTEAPAATNCLRL